MTNLSNFQNNGKNDSHPHLLTTWNWLNTIQIFCIEYYEFQVGSSIVKITCDITVIFTDQ